MFYILKLSHSYVCVNYNKFLCNMIHIYFLSLYIFFLIFPMSFLFIIIIFLFQINNFIKQSVNDVWIRISIELDMSLQLYPPPLLGKPTFCCELMALTNDTVTTKKLKPKLTAPFNSTFKKFHPL